MSSESQTDLRLELVSGMLKSGSEEWQMIEFCRTQRNHKEFSIVMAELNAGTVTLDGSTDKGTEYCDCYAYFAPENIYLVLRALAASGAAAYELDYLDDGEIEPEIKKIADDNGWYFFD